MELAVARDLFKRTEIDRVKRTVGVDDGLRYYQNQNDITIVSADTLKEEADKDRDPLRSANNRAPINFHGILIDQKKGYVGAIPPVIDIINADNVTDEELTRKIKMALGDSYDKKFKQLVFEASNCGNAWLHVWLDEADRSFNYSLVPSAEVYPIFNNHIDRQLLAVRRTYEGIEDDGKKYIFEEYWTKDEVSYFKRDKSDSRGFDGLEPWDRLTVVRDAYLNEYEMTNQTKHDFGMVPFIEFNNNEISRGDLYRYKELIDLYDKVYNGYANDLEDVQQVIFVIKGYEGEDLNEFKRHLSADKAVKLEAEEDVDSGITTLTIDIPVDARMRFLDMTHDLIYEMGQGVNPRKMELGNNSGVAIKMLYSQLELKCAALETEFREGLNVLVRCMMRHLGVQNHKDLQINQTWTRTAISNEAEQAQIVAMLADVSSKEAVAKSNPIVEDYQQELKLRETGNDSYANAASAAIAPKANEDDEELKRLKAQLKGD